MPASSTSTDPYWDNVALLCINDNKGDATTSFADQSNYARTITTVANAQYDTAQKPTGMTSSGLFDGTGDLLSMADDSLFDFGTNDFTIEAMIRLPNFADYRMIYTKRTDASTYGSVVFYVEATTGNIIAWATSNGTSADIFNVTVGTISVNTWYHVAINRTGSAIRTYLNGTLGGTATSSLGVLANSNSPRIGGDSDLYSMNGWISNVRITNGVGRYPSTCSVPSLPLPTATT